MRIDDDGDDGDDDDAGDGDLSGGERGKRVEYLQ